MCNEVFAAPTYLSVPRTISAQESQNLATETFKSFPLQTRGSADRRRTVAIGEKIPDVFRR